MIVKLSEKEVLECFDLAHKRNDHKIHLNRFSWQKDGVSSLENHFLGLKGEMAVAKVLEIDIDRRIFEKGDKGAADLIFNGINIEVKTRGKKGYDFALTKNDISLFKNDIGVLCWPGNNEGEIEVVGFISREKFSHLAVVKDYKYGKRLIAEPIHFTPLSKEALKNGVEGGYKNNPNRGVEKELMAELGKMVKSLIKEGVIHWEKQFVLGQSGKKYKVSIEELC